MNPITVPPDAHIYEFARANPGRLVEKLPATYAGALVAALVFPIRNPHHAFECISGLHLEVFDYQKSGFLVDGFVESPSLDRRQLLPRFVRRFVRYEDARAAAIEYARLAQLELVHADTVKAAVAALYAKGDAPTPPQSKQRVRDNL